MVIYKTGFYIRLLAPGYWSLAAGQKREASGQKPVMNSTDENIPKTVDNPLMKHDNSYQRNSAETESAAFTTLAASSFSIRSRVIVKMEPVTLMDATTSPPEQTGAATQRTPS